VKMLTISVSVYFFVNYDNRFAQLIQNIPCPLESIAGLHAFLLKKLSFVMLLCVKCEGDCSAAGLAVTPGSPAIFLPGI
jgi:hypothetical protein